MRRPVRLQVRQRRTFDGEIIPFGSAAGKHHFCRRTAQHVGDIVTSAINGDLASLSHGMGTRGVAIVFRQIGHHRRKHFRG